MGIVTMDNLSMEDAMSHRFRITNKVSGLVLGVFPGENEQDALDTMARDAGYANYAHILDIYGDDARNELLVEYVGAVEEEGAITIKITPTLGVVFYLSDLVDTEKSIWLGQEVPSTAAH